jgi:pimeloyl-ACP methyl ester carboxylesterase
MASNCTDQITLDQSFLYQNATHSYDIKWCQLGDPERQPVVFLHGTPWSSRVWGPYALALSRRYHVYLFDNPGFGDSPLEEELEGRPFAPKNEMERLDADLARQSQAFAALYKSWRTSWRGKTAHVIAHDHGGLMSLRAILQHGCQFSSLCLIDVVAIGPFGQPLFKKVAANPQEYLDLSDKEFEEVLENYIGNASYQGLSRETMHMLKEPWMREGGKAGFVRQLCQANSRSTLEVEGKYGNVGAKIPVKIIWGKQDRWILFETAQRLAHALGAKKTVGIEGAGHLVMYDQPVQLTVELYDWLISSDARPHVHLWEE